MTNYLKGRVSSFKFAIKGIRLLWREPNFRIHVIVFLIVLIFSFYLKITNLEWIVVILSSSFVLVSEAINTAIEKTLDFLTLEKDNTIEKIKDISAGFVLISAINAVIVGGIIFIPKIINIF